jgi:hypothetical protein
MADFHRSAVRLLFEFEGTNVTLRRRQWVGMVAPASDEFPKDQSEQEPRAGAWIDLLDREGRIVYRRQFGESPIAAHVSVYTGDEKQPFENLKTAPRGDFMVIVADIPDAETIAFYAPDPEVEGHGEAKEIARFRLRDEQQGDEPDKDDDRGKDGPK